MRVLVLGNDTPVGYSISAFANPLRRHELIGISIDKTRWGRERQVRRVVRDAAPDIVSLQIRGRPGGICRGDVSDGGRRATG